MQRGLFNEYEGKKKETKYAIKKKAIPFRTEIRSTIEPHNIITRLSGTGHRPDKLGGYHRLDQNARIIVPRLVDYLQFTHAVMARDPGDRIVVISGMAQGWDTWLMEAAVESGVCYTIAACPCPNQGSKWPQKAQNKCNELNARADMYVEVCELYDYDSMQLRNEYMVDNSDVVLAMWNGTSGGTGNCINYCNEVKMHYINFWDEYSLLLDIKP